jgi:two-component system, chemotaxis family, protein-glutamate methylesterase/glutaminase
VKANGEMADVNGSRRDVLVIGASAGGVEALQKLVSGLPADLPAAVLIVLHVWSRGESFLPQVLTRAGPLPAEHPRDGDIPQYGHIYVAPPDKHLLVEDGRMRLVPGPKENMHRPAVDVLFRTAAQCFGSRVIGILLTGYGGDGAAGLAAIEQRGGVTIVQRPDESRAPGMPESALRLIKPNYQLGVAEMAPVVSRIIQEASRIETKRGECAAESGNVIANEVDLSYAHTESPSGFICPECGGALWERSEEGGKKFRCRIGHAYSTDSLLDAENEVVEAALWTAVRSLEESAAIARRVAQLMPGTASEFEEKADARHRHAEVIRGLLARQAAD